MVFSVISSTEMRVIFLFLCLVGGLIPVNRGFIMRENVVFHHLQGTFVSRAHWKISIVKNIATFDRLITRVQTFINEASPLLVQLSETHSWKNQQHFTALLQQMTFYNDIKEKVLSQFKSYQPLRSKRALFPFIGEGYSFLFGLTTKKDLRDIRKAINDLGRNDEKIQHVLNSSLTILKDTRHDIQVNRHRANELLHEIDSISSNLKRLGDSTREAYNKLRMFIDVYLHMSALNNNMMELVQELVDQFQSLQLQLDLLSTGRLTPSIIPPDELLHVLLDIQKQLSPTLRLPINPEQHIWSYYQTIMCSTSIDHDNLIVIVNIPLVSIKDYMDIYEVINLPLIHGDYRGEKTVTKKISMLALYELESSTIAVDKARTKYSLLTEHQVSACLKSPIRHCPFNSPVYPINISKLCVIALFIGISEKIKSFCSISVLTNQILPQAQHLDDGLWALSLGEPLTVTINCDKSNKSLPETKLLNPPLDILRLKRGCEAFSDAIFLPGYQEFESSTTVHSDGFIDISTTNFTLWTPFYDEFPDFNSSWNLTALKDIKKIDMSSLINTVNSIKKVHVNPNPLWTPGNIALSCLLGLIVFGIIGYCVYNRYLGLGRAGSFCTSAVTVQSEPRDFPAAAITQPQDHSTDTTLSNVNTTTHVASAPPVRSVFDLSHKL